MKKRISVLVLMLALLASVTAHAAVNWDGTFNCDRKLSFRGTTAECFVEVEANEDTARIDATVKLMRGGSTVATWPLTGTGSATLTETMGCTSGQTYTLQVTGTVSGSFGTDNISAYVNATCP